MNDSLNIYSMIGIIVMDGVVAKNGTLLLDYTLTLMHRDGMKPKEAVIEAGKTRLRPILMTSLAFMLGVLPLVTAAGAGSAARQSMGTGVFGGMLISTFIATIFVPVFFTWFTKMRKKTKDTPPDGDSASDKPGKGEL